jgi:signal transduction histidine kinase
MARRRPHLGFRARVLGSFVAFLAIATFAGLLLQRAVLLDRLDREVDSSLEQERSELEQLAGPDGVDPETRRPFGDDVEAIFLTFLRRNVAHEGEVFITFVDGRFFRTSAATEPVELHADRAFVAAVADLASPRWGWYSTDAGPVRYLAVPLQYAGETRGVFVIANFVRGEREEVESTIRVAAGVMAGIILVATAAAWFVAGRLLRPIRQLTEAAESITETDLERRIPVVGHDEVARLAHQFNAMLDRLAGAFAVQRAFVDDAGHELRTPITVIRGYLEVMGPDPVERAETVAIVTDELDRMSRIVEDLLILAKAEQPDFLVSEVVEVADFTTDAIVKARALTDRDWHMDACASGEIEADRQRLTQAMLNLARNAHEHTPADAEVAIGSAWADTSIRLWVRDGGAGISPADQERIFERFARGPEGRGRSDGAGLGLAIVRSIADAHGGRVEIVSQPGAGATFTIVLPATRVSTLPRRALPLPPPTPDQRPVTEVTT